jgi:hypothetical protein
MIDFCDLRQILCFIKVLFVAYLGKHMALMQPNADLKKLSDEKQNKYRSGVGMLLCLVKHSIPDIANAVRELSKVTDGATDAHWKALLRVEKYVLSMENNGFEN